MFNRKSNVGLSNILNSKLSRRKPGKRPHGRVVGTTVVKGKLLGEIFERIERVAGIEPLLVLPVAALDLAIVAGRVGADELVADAQLGGGFLKQRRQAPLTARKPVGKLKSVVRLDTFHLDLTACVPRGQLPQKVRRGVGGLLRIGG